MKLKLIILSLFLLITIFAVPALAEELSRDADTQPTTTVSPTPTRKPLERNLREANERRKNNLTEARLKTCQMREKAVNKRTEALEKLVNNMEEKFAQIVNRVKEFYLNKLVPKGKTLTNYDSLIVDIEAKKATVDSSLLSAKESMPDFSCESDDPKNLLTDYRLGMQSTKKALQDYRTAIKNFIVAVRGLVGDK